LLVDVAYQAKSGEASFIDSREGFKPGLFAGEAAEPLPGKFDKDVLRVAREVAQALIIFPVLSSSETATVWAAWFTRGRSRMDDIPILAFTNIYDLPSRQIE
jgi:hypothetical protein